MSIKRRIGDKKPNRSSSMDNDSMDIQPLNKGVRSVQSVNPIDEKPIDDIPQATKGSGPINAIRNGLSALGGGIGNAIKSGASGLFGLKAIGSFTTSGVSKIADATNLSKKVVVGFLISTLTLGTGTGIMAFSNYHANNLLVKQEDIDDDCAEDLENSKVSVGGGTLDGNAEEYAAKAWAVAKAFGLSDEQAAGMLGNMQQESGMDSTKIEGIYDEPFSMDGPKKRSLISEDGLCNYVTGDLRDKYISSGWTVKSHTTKAGCTMASGSGGSKGSLNSSAYEGGSGHFIPGLGLFQFTGVEASVLYSYAESSSDKDWWDFDLQMAFSFDTTGGYGRATWVETWKSKSVSSPTQAAEDWAINFEGNKHAMEKRKEYAVNWYNKFKGTSGDTAYAQSILALANTIQGGSQSITYAKAAEKCTEADSVANADNSDLARAAVSYAYETKAQGKGNNGTELYQFVHDKLWGSGDIYMSCDRGVATAVRWSGYDDNFPNGNTDTQDIYLHTNSDKWQFVGAFGTEVSFDELQPGDILITTAARKGSAHGHIVLYVSNEVVKEKYPSSTFCFVSASFEERSPGCEVDVSSKGSQFLNQGYHVYRNIKKSEPSQYTDIAKGMNLKDR